MKVDFEVPPKTRAELEGYADALRRAFGQEDPFLDVVSILERGFSGIGTRLTFRIATRNEAGPRMGYVDPMQRTLNIREDVYEGLIKNVNFDRFTVSHEIGHGLLHTATMNRMVSPGAVPAYRSAEWQADNFAGALLMPRRLVDPNKSVRELAEQFGITQSAVRARLKIYGFIK